MKMFIIIYISFSILNASQVKLKQYNISSNLIKIKKEERSINKGLALDIKTDKDSHFNYILGYEGSVPIFSEIIEEDINKKKNYYIGFKYNF